ncbi:MAG: type II toxin-antitoxin system death-on-curing family toxin [Anaerolineae bacterium]|nr:type II toxin-antitoxin system death-on-curing family toxin [Anaerolineae bacterium]
MTRYLTLSELIYINGVVVRNEKILAGTQEIRDQILLEAAQARPSASAFGTDAYPTIKEKAAALLHSIARNHPFTDGNKRTAAVAAIFMLEVNGEQVTWDAEQALPMIIEAAEGRKSIDVLAAWFPTQPCSPQPEADADQDMQHIARIMTEHQWLLNELAQR